MKEDALYEPFPGFEHWSDVRISTDIWGRYLARLESIRERVGKDAAEIGVRRSMLAAALNTGAIEGLHRADRGLTVTVIDHVLDWAAHIRSSEGPRTEAYIKAGLEALDMALDVATSQMPKLTEAWLRKLHAVACAPQESATVYVQVGNELRPQEQRFEHGAYKSVPNHVTLPDGTLHAYCPVDQVSMEMARLVTELDSEAFLKAHPVVQASFAHHALTYIHPFQDGNGRVARALASVFFLRAASIPLLIYEDQQAEYFEALAETDTGNRDVFVRFVQDRALDLMALAHDLLAVPTEATETLTVTEPTDRIPPVAIEAAHRLHELVAVEYEAAVRTIETGPRVELQYSTMGYSHGARDAEGRRTVADSFPYAVLRAPQYGLEIGRWLAVYVSDSTEEPFPLVVRVHGRDEALEVRVSDVHPQLTTAAQQRVRAFVRRVAYDLATEMQEELERR